MSVVLSTFLSLALSVCLFVPRDVSSVTRLLGGTSRILNRIVKRFKDPSDWFILLIKPVKVLLQGRKLYILRLGVEKVVSFPSLIVSGLTKTTICGGLTKE